jgi:hypothetical protein
MRVKKQKPPMLRKPSKINALDITQRQKHLVFLRVTEPFSKSSVKKEIYDSSLDCIFKKNPE